MRRWALRRIRRPRGAPPQAPRASSARPRLLARLPATSHAQTFSSSHRQKLNIGARRADCQPASTHFNFNVLNASVVRCPATSRGPQSVLTDLRRCLARDNLMARRYAPPCYHRVRSQSSPRGQSNSRPRQMKPDVRPRLTGPLMRPERSAGTLAPPSAPPREVTRTPDRTEPAPTSLLARKMSPAELNTALVHFYRG